MSLSKVIHKKKKYVLRTDGYYTDMEGTYIIFLHEPDNNISGNFCDNYPLLEEVLYVYKRIYLYDNMPCENSTMYHFNGTVNNNNIEFSISGKDDENPDYSRNNESYKGSLHDIGITLNRFIDNVEDTKFKDKYFEFYPWEVSIPKSNYDPDEAEHSPGGSLYVPPHDPYDEIFYPRPEPEDDVDN